MLIKWTVLLALVSGLATTGESPMRPAGKSFDLGRNGADKVKITVETRALTNKLLFKSTKIEGFVIWSDTQKAIRFRIPADSFDGSNAEAVKLMAGDTVLDAKKHEWIEFESIAFKAVPDHQSTYDITGLLRVRGVEREFTTRGTIFEIRNPGANREKGFIGDMIHIRFTAEMTPSVFGIRWPSLAGKERADEIFVSVDMFGFTNDKPDRSLETMVEESFPKKKQPESAPTSRPAPEKG